MGTHRKELAEPTGTADMLVIAGQLGRRPRGVTGVAARCPFGYPAVIETAPTLNGAPNPTLLYLTCPTMAAAVSRVEASGGVRDFRAWVAADAEAKRTLTRITESYRARRAALAGDGGTRARLEAGIGGPSEPEAASCLHAYAAALLAARSGSLRAESGSSAPQSGRSSLHDDSVVRIWARFFPPAEEMWCQDGMCSRFESRSGP